jgi:hypothetical protein
VPAGSAALAPLSDRSDLASGCVQWQARCSAPGRAQARQNQIDPCAGAVDLRSRNVQLERIDESVDADAQRVYLLVFRVSRIEDSAPGHSTA